MRGVRPWLPGAIRALVGAFALSGCTVGAVKLPDTFGSFGGARSGVWLVTTSVDSGASESHALILSNTSGLCATYKRALPAIHDAGRAYQAAIQDVYQSYEGTYGDDAYAGFQSAQCEATRGYYEALAAATRRLYREGSRMLSFTLRQGPATAPTSGVFTQGGFDEGPGDKRFDGTYIEHDRNPYSDVVEALKDVDCTSDSPYDNPLYDALVGESGDLSFEAMPVYNGTLELTSRGDEAFQGLLSDAAIVGEDGLSFDARFSRCDVRVDVADYAPAIGW